MGNFKFSRDGRTNIHIELNSDGIVELLKSDEIMAVLKEQGEAMLSRLGDGYAMNEYNKGKSRANVSVYAETQEAYKDNMNNNTLLKAVR